MSLKFYTLLTLLFIVLLGNYVFFFITSESMPLNIFDIQLASYPIAIWVTLPFFLFYIINILLMSVNNVQNYFKLRNYERDFEKLKDAFYNGYLRKEKKYEFKTKRYQLLGEMLQNSIITPKKGTIIEDFPKVQTVLNAIEEIQAGKVPDMKRFSLSKDNELMIEHAKNMLHSDSSSAEKMLNSAESFDDATIKEAFATFAATSSLNDILKYKKFVSIRSLLHIIERVDSEEHPLVLSLEDTLDLCRHVTQDINPYGFIEIAIAVRNALIPEERIKLFETLLEEKYEVNEAMLYTFLDLEMLDNARELLENFDENDFLKYRAFLALKDINYSCNIDLLVGRECP